MKTFIYILLFIWQLPQNLIALCMLPFMGKKTKLHYKRYCNVYECSNMSGGISLGNFIFLSPSSARLDPTIAHELGHVKDSHIMGPLYLLIIGLPSIIWAIVSGDRNYYSFYTEKWANKNSFVHEEKQSWKERVYWTLEFDEGKSLDDIK